MLKNYLLTAIRNLWRSKAFSFINLTGLAVGMASATLLLLVIHNESTYDDFQQNKAVLYKVWNRDIVNGALTCQDFTPKGLGPALVHEYPGITNMTRVDDRWSVTIAGDKKMSSHVNVVDTSFLSMFSFPMIAGNRATALSNANSMVVTESMAKKLFGDKDPINQSVTIDRFRYQVTGVLKDLPPNSNFQFEFLLPWSYQHVVGNDDDTRWGANTTQTYVQLTPTATETALDKQIKKTIIHHSKNTETAEVFLHPLSKWHLYTEFENGHPSGGAITVVRLLSIIAAFILLIACINFMNLSTARSERRAKEVGIRKVAGAHRGMLIGQFLGESLLMSLLAAALALGIVELTLPAFDTLVGKALTIPYANPYFWGSALVFILGTSILAGSYPAFFLSAFRPVAVLKGVTKKAHGAFNPRKILVVTQFSFAIVLIICTLIVLKQIDYARDRTTGYDASAIVYHWNTGDLNKNYDALKRDLLSSGLATEVARSAMPLTSPNNDTYGLKWPGKNIDDKTDFDRFFADQNLIRTAGLQLVQGRDMDLARYPTDSAAVLLNESAVKAMGFKNPIGQTITDEPNNYHVIGVVKDFVSGSPFEKIRPMVIMGTKNNFLNVINIRLAPGRSLDAGMDKLRQLFTQYNPDYPFEYHFVRDDYANKFRDATQIATLSGLFAGLTIFISCLGLFGLAAYMAEARIKEIGVRKVLGASVLSITTLLTKEFLALVLLALVIASPIAWFVMDQWLSGFQYRIHIDASIFLLAGGLSVLISILTVGGQAITAARSNPARSLRPN
jgi:putative ABC transport system permease protein